MMKKVIIAVLSAFVANSFAGDVNSLFQKGYKDLETVTVFSKSSDGKDFIVDMNSTYRFDTETFLRGNEGFRLLEKFKLPFKSVAKGVPGGKPEVVSFTDADGKDLIAEIEKMKQEAQKGANQ